MAIVVPIVTDYSDKGMQAALRSIRNAEGPMNKLSAATSLLGPALATAGVAAGAFAVKLGVEGVQAAMAEEAELSKLHTTLTNLGFGEQAAAVDAFVDAQARASTFSDSDLRPSLASLAQATNDVKTAQDLLTIAMDASVGSGKELDSVSQALAKAANGNTTSLQKMFPWLDKNLLKTEGLDYATAALAERFTGQASAAADTWSGKLGNVTEAFGELQESFGKGFLDGLGEAETGGKDLADSLYELQGTVEELGRTIGSWLATLITFANNVTAMKKSVDDFRKSIEGTNWAKIFDGFASALSFIANGPVLFLLDQINRLIDAIKALQNLDFSLPNIPGVYQNNRAAPATAGASTRSAAPVINVTVNGAIDPIGVAKQIRRTLARADLRTGIGI